MNRTIQKVSGLLMRISDKLRDNVVLVNNEGARIAGYCDKALEDLRKLDERLTQKRKGKK
jgi:hypothetical protein